MVADKEAINENNTVFYSTANAGYAIFAATSLLTIRKQVPNAKLLVLSSGLSDYDKKILDKNNIDYLELDLSDKFTKTWDYPIECFYIFAGPELLYSQGVEYSVYVDGDILCKTDPLSNMPHVAGIASAAQDSDAASIFGVDFDKIKKIWNIPEGSDQRRRINSGVVYFNNKRMTQIRLQDRSAELFQICLASDIPRKGDDSLLSLLQYVVFDIDDIKYLSSSYNYALQFNDWFYPVTDLVFFHFSIDKPWKKRPYRHSDEKLDVFNPYVREWRSVFIKVSPIQWLKSLIQ